MRTPFPDIVEKGRLENHSTHGTSPGDTFGAFFLKPPAGACLRVIACDGAETGWDHGSVTVLHEGRTPTWAEMCWVKGLFFRDDEWCVQFHPAAAENISVHDHCLHLWRPVGAELPRPPRECV